MIETYQEQIKLLQETAPVGVHELATVGEVYADGVTLIFDGSTEPSAKRYLCNKSVTFTAGDRVVIRKVSGTYIVECAIGAPTSGPVFTNVYEDALIICPFDNNLNNIAGQNYTIVRSDSSLDPTDYGTFNSSGCLTMNRCRYTVSPSIMDKLNAEFTFTAWVNYSHTGLSPNYKYRRVIWSILNSSYFPMPEIDFDSYGSTNKFKLNAQSSVTAYNGEWHWLCLTRTSTGFVLRIDRSVEILSYPCAMSVLFTATSATDTLAIGHYSYPLNGDLAYFCFWDRILTDAEMDYLWNNGSGNFS